MARAFPDEVAAVLKDYGFGNEAVWDCHGSWVIYHSVLERVAAKANIEFDMPVVLEANGQGKCAALCVAGRMGEKAEWSVGEAAPGNNKNNYPFAMAEKRAKDRVVLKLIGLHGLVYSEDESDDFKPDANKPPAQNGSAATNGKPPPPAPTKDKTPLWERESFEVPFLGDWQRWDGLMYEAIKKAPTLEKLTKLQVDNAETIDRYSVQNSNAQANLNQAFVRRMGDLSQGEVING